MHNVQIRPNKCTTKPKQHSFDPEKIRQKNLIISKGSSRVMNDAYYKELNIDLKPLFERLFSFSFEIVNTIFSFLRLKDLRNFRTISKDFNNFVHLKIHKSLYSLLYMKTVFTFKYSEIKDLESEEKFQFAIKNTYSKICINILDLISHSTKIKETLNLTSLSDQKHFEINLLVSEQELKELQKKSLANKLSEDQKLVYKNAIVTNKPKIILAHAHQAFLNQLFDQPEHQIDSAKYKQLFIALGFSVMIYSTPGGLRYELYFGDSKKMIGKFETTNMGKITQHEATKIRDIIQLSAYKDYIPMEIVPIPSNPNSSITLRLASKRSQLDNLK